MGFFEWVAAEEKRLLNWWIFTRSFAACTLTLWSLYTVIYAYKHFTVPDKSIISIVGCFMTVITIVSMRSNPTIRKWIVHHPWTMATLGSIVDGVTEYFILINPLVKFIFDAISTYLWFELWAIQGQERINAILNYSPNKRVVFRMSTDIWTSVAVLVASIIGLFVELPIVFVAWASIVCTCVSYFLSTTRFVISDIYMRNHNIPYPYLEEMEKLKK